jgi:hypothetical protein
MHVNPAGPQSASTAQERLYRASQTVDVTSTVCGQIGAVASSGKNGQVESMIVLSSLQTVIVT